MITFSLQSGSNGNCIYVEAGDARLLFDCGISGTLAAERMAAHGRNIADVTAIIVSHEHDDHVRGAGVLHRRYRIPLYITQATQRRAQPLLGALTRVHHFLPGARIEFGDVRVFTIPTPHDAVEPVGFVVEHERRRLGILTDLGHPFRDLKRLLESLDAAYLESNYDPEMLDTGPYPPELKARIRGRHGHLSNGESATLSSAAVRHRLKWIAAAHLSETNNEPELALDAHHGAIGKGFPVHVASRYAVGDVLSV
ncbi:MAG: MBL fold metallo-hydrolase [Phycisphaerae bacterium]|nr:MBL fold metallo-hydrolase [Phycisphaerae bacterium]